MGGFSEVSKLGGFSEVSELGGFSEVSEWADLTDFLNEKEWKNLEVLLSNRQESIPVDLIRYGAFSECSQLTW